MASANTVIGLSLPPMVEGQLRCFLSVKLGNLEWTIPRPPRDIQVKVLWWGQSGNGAVIRPQVDSDPNYIAAKNKHAEVHFPVRCGPRQFQAYLNDMSGLHLDVVFGASCASFAYVNVNDIGLLSPSKVVDSYYPLICTSSAYQGKEVGKLKVAISFKSISDTYNISSSIIPTTDKEFHKPVHLKKKEKSVDYEKVTLNEADEAKDRVTKKKISFDIERQTRNPVPVKSKLVKTSTKPLSKLLEETEKSTDLGTDANERAGDEVSKEDSKSDGEESDKDIIEPFVARNIGHVSSVRRGYEGNSGHQSQVVLKGNQRAIVLSLLLNKTQSLRNSMIKTTLQSDDVPLKHKENRKSPSKSSGVLMKELLGDDDIADNTVAIDKCSASQEMEKLDMKVVDLLLGKDDDIEQLLRKVDMSLDSNVSYFSDDQDPLHDTSLLDYLLYTTQALPLKDESSVISLNESDHGVMNAKKNMQMNKLLNKQISDESSDSIPTKDTHTSVDLNTPLDDETIIDVGNSDCSNMMSTPLQDKNVLSAHNVTVPEGITVESLTQLGRVKSAKVILKEFRLCSDSPDYGVVYFVEFNFPVSTVENQSVSVENVRHVSRHVIKYVDFGRLSVFPILFNEEMVEYWWQQHICFKLHMKYDRQEKAKWLGEGYFKLREILLNSQLKTNTVVDIYNDAPANGDHQEGYAPIGQLKLYIELTLERGKSVAIKSEKPPIPSVISIPDTKVNEEICTKQLTPIKINTKFKRKENVESKMNHKNPSHGMKQPLNDEKRDNVFLHNLIAVSEGENIVYSSNDGSHLCNSYLVCRVFWNCGELKSKICWSTENPNYGFQQIIPVTLETSTIQKMENNFMIIEVWHKSATTDKDKLIGMSKLPLHQFFLSFKDPKLGETIMKSKYPVVANDGPVPVINLLSSKEHGCLRVLFALGTHDQVMQVVQMKNINHMKNLDFGKKIKREEIGDQDQDQDRDHHVEISIGGVKGLMQDNNEVWGESDCYIQYHFPEQYEITGELRMTNFKTKTTLCLPNPVFNHSLTHSFSMEKNVPLQRLLLDCFKKGSNDSVQFELWKRHYYPNVRDQLISKASLALANLCAIIGMCDGQDSNQSFDLPLESNDDGNEARPSKLGTLEVFLRYKQRSKESHDQFSQQVVCLSVSINRLCGLKDSLGLLSKKKKNLKHASKSGPNVFVKFYISFIGKTSVRITNVAAKSFCPTFNYHVDFPLPLTFGDDRKSSLVEYIEDGFIVCEVMHEFVEVHENDAVIGVAKIPLKELLSHSTGIKGWWELKVPNMDIISCDIQNAGGIEVNAKFTRNTDRQQIVNLGRGMGWSPRTDLNLHDEAWFPSTDDSDCSHSIVNFYVDIVVLPRNVIDDLLLMYENVEHRFGTLYCRYKFYNKAPIYSKSVTVRLEKNMHVCSLRHSSCHEIIPNTSFAWYLREEKLEIQFWLSWSNYTAMDASFTRQKDKLVGSIYVDMSLFSHSPYEEKIISGSYPLFNANCDSICNATARISVAFNTNLNGGENGDLLQKQYDNSLDDSLSSNEGESLLLDLNGKKTCVNEHIKDEKEDDSSGDSGDFVKVHVEEAMHLPDYSDIYVTYQLPKSSLISTCVSKSKGKHCWNFQKQHKIELNILKDRRIVFHVWRCTGEKQNIDRDILVGTAELDAGPLFYGLNQILGWYNIYDLNRQVVGQIKLGVLPSIVLSASISSKFFKFKEPVAPIHLSTTCYPNPIKSYAANTVTENNSDVSLFQKLDCQIKGLQGLIGRIQERAYGSSHFSNLSQCVFSDPQSSSEMRITDVSKDIGEVVESTVCPKQCNTETLGLFHCHSNDVYGGCSMEETPSAVMNDGAEEIPIEEDSAHSPIDMNYNVNSIAVLPSVGTLVVAMEKDHEAAGENCVELKELGNNTEIEDDNSTSELWTGMNNFEKKFSHIANSLKKDVDFDQDSWISDSEVIDIHLHQSDTNYEFKRPVSPGTQEEETKNDDLIALASTVDFSPIEIIDKLEIPDVCNIRLELYNGDRTDTPSKVSDDPCQFSHPSGEGNVGSGEVHFQVGEIKDDSVINISSSSDHLLEDNLALNVISNDSIIHPISDNLDNICDKQIASGFERQQEVRQSNQETHNLDNEEFNTNQSSNDYLAGLEFSSDEELACSTDTPADSTDANCYFDSGTEINLPNFFMRPEELAESMQALRMAAKVRQSPRRGVSIAESSSAVKANVEPNSDFRVTQELKEKIKRQSLPIEATEMARIASIFSLKSERK